MAADALIRVVARCLMDLYRAEAKRRHSGRATTWRGKWRPDPDRAIAQAKRWQLKEPFALIEVVSTNGMRATLEDMETARSTRTRP